MMTTCEDHEMKPFHCMGLILNQITCLACSCALKIVWKVSHHWETHSPKVAPVTGKHDFTLLPKSSSKLWGCLQHARDLPVYLSLALQSSGSWGSSLVVLLLLGVSVWVVQLPGWWGGGEPSLAQGPGWGPWWGSRVLCMMWASSISRSRSYRGTTFFIFMQWRWSMPLLLT